MSAPTMRERAAAALDATHAVEAPPPWLQAARDVLACWLDGERVPKATVTRALRWVEEYAGRPDSRFPLNTNGNRA